MPLIPSGAQMTPPLPAAASHGAPGLPRATWATSHFLFCLCPPVVRPVLSTPLQSPLSELPLLPHLSALEVPGAVRAPSAQLLAAPFSRLQPRHLFRLPSEVPCSSLMSGSLDSCLLASFPVSPEACLHLHSTPARPPRALRPAPQLAPCPTSLITQWVSVTHGGPASPPAYLGAWRTVGMVTA